MRSQSEYETVLRLVSQGLNHSEISRRTGISRSTIRAWRNGTQRSGHRHFTHGCEACNSPAHDFAALPGPQYAYLLGQYLGDGCISSYKRWTFLRIACCDDYPDVMAETAAAVAAIVPTSKVGRTPAAGCTYIRSYSRQWPCLFPQHGPGRKHERPIVLTAWQTEHCERHPEMLLRGLVHSDGARCSNRVRSPAGKEYVYPRYFFNNESADILRIFCAACDLVGVRYTWCRDNQIAVSRRADVAVLDSFIGPKT